MVWGGSNDHVKLHKSDATWKVFLRNDGGQTLSRSEMQPVKCSR